MQPDQPQQPYQPPLDQQPVSVPTQPLTQPEPEYAPTQVTNPVVNPLAKTGTSGLAIAGLILAFLVPLIGLILSVIALRQIKSTGQGGRRFAIAGILVSLIIFVLGAVEWYYLQNFLQAS